MLFVIKTLVALFPGLVALFLILRAFLDGNVSDLEYALWLLAITAGSLALVPPGRLPRVPWPMLRTGLYLGLPLLGVALIFPLTVVVLMFGETDIAAFMFHLIFDMDGTPDGTLWPYIVTVIIYWAVVLLTLWRVRFLTARLPGLLAPAVVLGGLLWLNPLVGDIARNQLAAAYGTQGTLLDHYTPPQVNTASGTPNLVLIYLESLEQTYREAPFGDAYAPLAALGREGAVFTNVGQAFGTGWSLGGTISTTCGAPLMPYGAIPARRLSDVIEIMPEVTCLGGLLHDHGYTATYVAGTQIMGNKMGFYGFDNFLTTHQVTHVIDSANMDTPRATAERARRPVSSSWGMRDELVFEAALREAEARYASGTPFELTVATMDTHGPKGFTSPACTDAGMPATSQDMRPAVRCTAELTLAFVRALQAMIPEEELRIVIQSDHLAHLNAHTDTLDQFDRRNTVIYLGPDITPGIVIDKPGVMFDLLPTTLDLMGWLDHPEGRAGLGVSLLRATPTLREDLTLDALNRALQTDVTLAKWLWRKPDGTRIARGG